VAWYTAYYVGGTAGAAMGYGWAYFDQGQIYEYDTLGVGWPQGVSGEVCSGFVVNPRQFAGNSMQASLIASLPKVPLLGVGVDVFGRPGGAWGMASCVSVGYSQLAVSGSLQYVSTIRIR
jgi:hypothetical protein